MKITLTPFLIVLGILETILLFMSIYYSFIDNNGGGALGGAIAFIGLIIFLFILVLEQLLINYAKFEKENIWIIESIIIIPVAIWIYFNGISIG